MKKSFFIFILISSMIEVCSEPAKSCPSRYSTLSDGNDFSSKNLSGCDFRYIRFHNRNPIKFYNCDLRGANFTGKKIKAIFEYSDLRPLTENGTTKITSFFGTSFRNTTFSNTKINGAIFDRARLGDVTFTNNSDLSLATFGNATFGNAKKGTFVKFIGASCRHADFSNATIETQINIDENPNAKGNTKGSDFTSAQFVNITGETINIGNSTINSANFSSMTPNSIKYLNVKNSSAKNTIWDGGLYGGFYKNGKIQYLPNGPLFINTDLSGSSFKNANLQKTLFSGPVFSADFTGADLTNSIVDLNCYETNNSLWFASLNKAKGLETITSVNPRGEVYTSKQISTITNKIETLRQADLKG